MAGKMKVTILSLDDAIASSVAGPADIFGQVGIAWNDMQGLNRDPRFDVEVVTADGRPSVLSSNVLIQPHGSLQSVHKTDIIVISSGITDDFQTFHSTVIPWLRKHYAEGVALAAICTGSFLLAATQLLSGRQATTHWGYAGEFKKRYPDVDLQPKRLVTDDRNLLCSGGANAYADLCLYLVEKYCGHDIAKQLAKALVLEQNRVSQMPFTTFAFQKGHGDGSILLAQNYLEENYLQPINMTTLARIARLSERTLTRRFKQSTGDTPLAYLHRVRVESAKRELLNFNISIEEAGSRAGFADLGRFRAVFRTYMGMTPSVYRRKYL